MRRARLSCLLRNLSLQQLWAAASELAWVPLLLSILQTEMLQGMVRTEPTVCMPVSRRLQRAEQVKALGAGVTGAP